MQGSGSNFDHHKKKTLFLLGWTECHMASGNKIYRISFLVLIKKLIDFGPYKKFQHLVLVHVKLKFV